MLLYHLQRHSDHHANPTRRYQALRDFEESPVLPTGYAGMIVLAIVPAVWRRVMDPRVLAHFDGDLSRANLISADLSGADLNGADLNRADLRHVDVSFAHLSKADLTDAMLSGAHLSNIDLTDAMLRGANLRGAQNVTQTQLDKACGTRILGGKTGQCVISVEKLVITRRVAKVHEIERQALASWVAFVGLPAAR